MVYESERDSSTKCMFEKKKLHIIFFWPYKADQINDDAENIIWFLKFHVCRIWMKRGRIKCKEYDDKMKITEYLHMFKLQIIFFELERK